MRAAEFSVPERRAAVSLLEAKGPWSRVLRLLQRVLALGRRAPRRLRLCESLPLGERRFVAVVEFEHSRFLVGGTSASLVLLARLGTDCDEVGRNGGDALPAENAAGNFREAKD